MSNVDIESDDVTQSTSLKLSFIVKYLLPDVRADTICYDQEASSDGTPGTMMKTGSAAEGLYLPNMMTRLDTGKSVPIAFNSDIDTMFCVGMVSGARLETWRQNGDLRPGFCRWLKPISSGADDRLYYSSTQAREEMREKMSYLDPSCFSVVDTPENRVAALLEVKEVPLNMDVVRAVCAEWPEEASEWRERNRPANWPSRELIDDIPKTGICDARL